MVTTSIATPTLQLGTSGTAVQNMQELLLKQVGVGGLSADGIFGPITDLAVRVFQRRSFLDDDGIVGPQTWNLLMMPDGVSHLPTLRRGTQGALVERLQQALTLGPATGPLNEVQQIIGTRGFYFGRIDGDFGPMTEQAIRDFQQNPPFNNPSITPVDGIVGPKTWDGLKSLVTRVSHIFL